VKKYNRHLNLSEWNLAPQSYWDSSYEKIKFKVADNNDPIRKWIEHYIPRGYGNCFEIGCFPGRYLTVFGDLGYELNGIDLTPRVKNDLPMWLKKNGYSVAYFECNDFSNNKNNRKYDIVCSFGFIEHFIDFESYLIKHGELVANNGYLVISTPNFSGFIQNKLHYCLDKENYNRHNINAMNPLIWAAILKTLGFEIIFTGWFGNFDFWVDNQKRGRISLFLINFIHALIPLLRNILPEGKKLYAPYCGLIAKKTM